MFFRYLQFNLSWFFNSFEDEHVHVEESNEGNYGGGYGGVPYYGDRVPEDVGRVTPGLARLDKVGPVWIYKIKKNLQNDCQ